MLTLNLVELVAIGASRLYVTGDSGDALIVTDEWEQMGSNMRDGNEYDIYERMQGGNSYELFVLSGLNTLGANFKESFEITSSSFSAIDGGAGFDVLVMNGDFDLDLTVIGDNLLRNIEVIDLTGGGAGRDNVLIVSAVDIEALGGLRESDKIKLIVEGDAGDSVSLASGQWSMGTTSYGDGTYQLYEQNNYQVIVNADVSVEILFSNVELGGDDSYKIIGEDVDDYSGYSVSSAGDVNGDGYDDVIIGAYQAEEGSETGGGD